MTNLLPAALFRMIEIQDQLNKKTEYTPDEKQSLLKELETWNLCLEARKKELENELGKITDENENLSNCINSLAELREKL